MIISNHIKINLSEISEGVADEIKTRFTFRNPAYDEALRRLRAMGKHDAKPRNVPKYIRGWLQKGNQLIIPRGCASEIIKFTNLPYLDQTRKLTPIDLQFKGELKPAQEPAVRTILSRRFTTICSPTGSGKTVMALYAIVKRKQPALVIVHTAALAKQWVERAIKFLGINEQEIGIIGQGSRSVGNRLTIALVQTLRKCADEIAPKIGHLVVDECHHVPASTFTQAITPFDCVYSLGLSATHDRRDGLTPLIYWYVGPLVYEVSKSTLIKDGDIVPVKPIIRKTNFLPSPHIDPTWQRSILIQELVEDHTRNNMIVNDIANETGPCIVLTDRKAHADMLTEMLINRGIKAEVCHGDIPKSIQEKRITNLNEGELKVMVATGQLLGEGFDCKNLTALFLATPIKFSGRLIQYLGRVTRSAEGKTSAKVYDYWDINVPVLMRAAKERMRTYNKLLKQDQIPTPKTQAIGR